MRPEELPYNSCWGREDAEPESPAASNHDPADQDTRSTDDVTFTGQPDQLAKATDELGERLETLSNQARLAALDREWELTRELYMVSEYQCGRYIPTQAGSLTKGILATVFGCFWVMLTLAMTRAGVPVLFPIAGVAFVFATVVISVSRYTKASEYLIAEQHFRARRRELLNRIPI